MLSKFILGIVLCAAPAVAVAQEVKCAIKVKYVCEASGCNPVPAKVWSVVDITAKTYARCDAKGCDTYGAKLSTSGAFLNIDIPDRGVIAKMSSDGSSFHEVATLGHSIFVSFGSCK